MNCSRYMSQSCSLCTRKFPCCMRRKFLRNSRKTLIRLKRPFCSCSWRISVPMQVLSGCLLLFCMRSLSRWTVLPMPWSLLLFCMPVLYCFRWLPRWCFRSVLPMICPKYRCCVPCLSALSVSLFLKQLPMSLLLRKSLSLLWMFLKTNPFLRLPYP